MSTTHDENIPDIKIKPQIPDAFKLKTILLAWYVDWNQWHERNPNRKSFADYRCCYDLADFIRSDFKRIEQMMGASDE